MNKIRVAFFAEILIRDFDGASRTIFQIIDRIPNSTFEFLFICGTPPTEEFAYETVILPSVTLPFNNNYKMAIPYLSNKKINKKLKKFKPDIIHISTPSLLGNFGLDFAVSHGLPVITIYHTHFVSYIDYYLEKASL